MTQTTSATGYTHTLSNDGEVVDCSEAEPMHNWNVYGTGFAQCPHGEFFPLPQRLKWVERLLVDAQMSIASEDHPDAVRARIIAEQEAWDQQ